MQRNRRLRVKKCFVDIHECVYTTSTAQTQVMTVDYQLFNNCYRDVSNRWGDRELPYSANNFSFLLFRLAPFLDPPFPVGNCERCMRI